jgi:two-component system cell cycle sensor histidine kinase/response regulator CckA
MIESLYANHAERLKKIEVVFISGYAEDAFVDSYGTERSFNFLPKPFTLKQLASKVKEVLDARAVA